MATPPFKVKALFDYTSPHDDDLNFPANQIITVTEEEDADWYIGEYPDASGETRSGLFPKNFVERYEPAPPPRPVRTAKARPPEASSITPQQQPPESTSHGEQSVLRTMTEEASDLSTTASKSMSDPSEKESQPSVAQASTAAKPTTAKSPPPPVTEKSSAFRDRIAAFNKQNAGPIAPFKPAGVGNSFIKKPFVAPPPSRDAYVPPPRDAAPAKVYRREEDPEIEQRRRQDQEDAEKAGLLPLENEEDQDQPKTVSLKDRIALLQKQQLEQAQRRATSGEASKPKRPGRTQTEQQEHDQGAKRQSIESERDDLTRIDSDPNAVLSIVQPLTHADEREEREDGDSADDVSESAEPDREMINENQRHPQAPAREPNVGDEEDTTEEDVEEDSLDEETRHQMALRERMAKLSGGMGMPGMFAMPMPGMNTAPPPRRKPQVDKPMANEALEVIPGARPPMPPPAETRHHVPSNTPARRITSTEEGDTNRTEASQYGPNEVVDVEDIETTNQSPPSRRLTSPLVKDHKSSSYQPAAVHASPPLPPGHPSEKTARLARPTSPPMIRSPSPGSESDDELPEEVQRESQPPIAVTIPPSVPSRSSVDSIKTPLSPSMITSRPELPSSPSSLTDKRASRAVPPIPIASPPRNRGPPPPPPDRAPATGERSSGHVPSNIEGESDYEGDYDTDIASTDKHKDALQVVNREMPRDADRAPTSSQHQPPPLPFTRAAPPPPPSKLPAGRPSADLPRGAPPPVPHAPQQHDDDEDEYDPYRYTATSVAPTSRPPPPAPRPSAPAPPLPVSEPRQSLNGSEGEDDRSVIATSDEDGVEEDRGAQGRKTTSEHRSSHVPVERSAPPPPSDPSTEARPPALPSAPSRRSTDAAGTLMTSMRPSIEQSRSSLDPGFIAQDINMADGSQWWIQPNTPPKAFQDRADLIFEVEETTSSKRGGKVIVARDVYVLFADYSQTTVTARFESNDPGNVQFEQKHLPPPQRPRQDQLEEAHARYGAKIVEEASKAQNSTVGDGSAHGFVMALYRANLTALPPIGLRAYGCPVYANLSNASINQQDEIRPGDVITFRNAKFSGKHGPMHTKYSLEVGKPDHVAIVADWDGTKKKVKVWEQGREKGKVKSEGYRLGDLRSGEVRVWRVMGRDWVGWQGES